jgi:hypothetical protein
MDDSGRAGLRFFDLTKESREQLDQWLTAQCEKAEKTVQLASPPHPNRRFRQPTVDEGQRRKKK